MAKQKPKQFYESYRAERARELQEFADVLKGSTKLIIDLKPLTDAVADCYTSKPNGNLTHWGYKIKGLTFKKVEDLDHIRPKVVKDVDIELTVEMAAPCTDDDWEEDCMVSLIVDIILSDSGKKYKQAWHFDRHLGGDTQAAHPIYHFHHGGRHIWDYGDDFFGSMLVLESPRIAHLPLDGILAIDFVLSNYFGTEWANMKSNASYKKLVAKMQKRFWKPYICSLHSVWTGATGVYSIWDPAYICPQIIKEEKLAFNEPKVSGKRKK